MSGEWLETTDNFAWRVFNNIGIKPTTRKTILSVGSRPSSRDYILTWFIEQGFNATILEIFKPYVDELRSKGFNVIEGDVRTIELKEYDYIVWWHGPEHISLLEGIEVTKKLKTKAKEALIYCVPWGEMASPAVDGNSANIHSSSYEPMDFLGLGMKEFHWGMTGVPNAVIIGYWKAPD